MRFEHEEKILKEQFAKSEPGSQEQQRIIEALCKLEELNQKEIKDGVSFEETSARIDALEAETEMKKEETKQHKKVNIIRLVIDGVTVVVTIVGTCVLPWKAWKRGMKFEETGTFSSQSERKVNGIFRLFKR